MCPMGRAAARLWEGVGMALDADADLGLPSASGAMNPLGINRLRRILSTIMLFADIQMLEKQLEENYIYTIAIFIALFLY